MGYRVTLLTMMVIGIIVVNPLPSSTNAQGCTPEQRVELLRSGYTKEEVNSICGNPMEPPPPNYPEPGYRDRQPYRQQYRPPMGEVCVTEYGTCTMMQPLPRGASCVCYTAYGAIPGFVE